MGHTTPRRGLLCAVPVLLTACTAFPAWSESADARGPERSPYFFLYAGTLDPTEESITLEHRNGSSSIGGGRGWGFHRMWSYELDLHLQSSSYDLPPGIGRPDLGDDALEFSTVGVFVNLRFSPRRARFRPQTGVGLGLGVIDVAVDNPDIWVPHSLESELSLLTQLLAGFDVRITRRSHLGVEYRELFAVHKLDFAGERIAGGGQSVVVSFRVGF